MKLVVAFGNPGNEYNFTRHNFGFLLLDFYFKLNNLTWNQTEQHHAIYKKTDQNIIFIKPTTFYNNVGMAISEFKNYYKIKTEDILIICDDFNLDFGSSRYKKQGSAGGNNGLKSTISHLKTENFPRLRLGTKNDPIKKRLGDADFVLSKFTDEECGKLPQILSDFTKKLDEILKID